MAFPLIIMIGNPLHIIMWAWYKILYVVNSHYLFGGSMNEWMCIVKNLSPGNDHPSYYIPSNLENKTKQNKMNLIWFSWAVRYLYSELKKWFDYVPIVRDFFFFFFRAAPWYMEEVPRLGVRATAAGLCHSHSNSNVGSEPRLWLTPQLTAHWILNPLSETRDRTHILIDTTWIRFHSATIGTLIVHD